MNYLLCVLERLRRLFPAASVAVVCALFTISCSVSGSKAAPNANSPVNGAQVTEAPKRAVIDIQANGPADTVRVFYKHLREKKFREAIFLTNLRPAVEGLTDTELKDFAIDFEAIAGQVPADVVINGEIISGDRATVTANLPNDDGDKNELQTIKLRRQGDYWVILTADEIAEAKIRKEGKNYFYALRIETHEEEARLMLERVSKAQLAHSLQNGGLFTDAKTLISAGLLPDDILTSESTGYKYTVTVAADKKSYFATATPAVYGKSGRLSFILIPDPKGVSRITSKDNGGEPMSK